MDIPASVYFAPGLALFGSTGGGADVGTCGGQAEVDNLLGVKVFAVGVS